MSGAARGISRLFRGVWDTLATLRTNLSPRPAPCLGAALAAAPRCQPHKSPPGGRGEPGPALPRPSGGPGGAAGLLPSPPPRGRLLRDPQGVPSSPSWLQDPGEMGQVWPRSPRGGHPGSPPAAPIAAASALAPGSPGPRHGTFPRLGAPHRPAQPGPPTQSRVSGEGPSSGTPSCPRLTPLRCCCLWPR